MRWGESMLWLCMQLHCLGISRKTMVLQIYGSRQPHRAWDGENWWRCCGVTAAAKIWLPNGNSCKGPVVQGLCIYRLRWFHRDWDGANWVVGELHVHKNLEAPTGIPTRAWRTNDHALHIYEPSLFHRTWDEANIYHNIYIDSIALWDTVNHSKDCGVTGSARIRVPDRLQANDHA